MTRIGRRLIEDFLLPALNENKYGELLKWIDRDNCYFSIRWSHKNAAKWTLADTKVFQDWDKLKGHYHPEVKGYYMQAKQRFRAALYKLSSVRTVPCEDKHVKKYQLVLDPEKRKIEYIGSPKIKCPKKVVENNRVSVITKHTSGKEEKSSPTYYAPPSSPPSPASSDRSDCSETVEFKKCIHDYKIGQRYHNHMVLGASSNQGYHVSLKKDGPLREVNDDLIRGMPYLQRTPHVPIQPVPVYNGGPKLPNDNSTAKRFESPRVLLVKTYNDDVSPVKEQCIEYEEAVGENSSDYVLNLSVKSDDSDVASR